MCTDPMITMSLYDEGTWYKVHGARYTVQGDFDLRTIEGLAVNPEPCTLDHFAYPKVRESKKREGVYDD